MRKLQEMFLDLKALLAPSFRTVRITAVQSYEQLLAEVETINVDNLPGVIIVYESSRFTDQNRLRESTVPLVLIDHFTAGSDEKALSAFQASEALLELFPVTGLRLQGVTYFPAAVEVVPVDKAYVCFALSLTARQGAG